MKKNYFLYVTGLSITCIAILLICNTLLYFIAYATMGSASSSIAHTISAFSIGVAIAVTMKLRPKVRRLTGVNRSIEKKLNKFHEKYPIIGPELPLRELEHGDQLVINDYGACTYSGKFMKKHIIIPNTGDEAFEMTPEELKSACTEVRGESGLKWKA